MGAVPMADGTLVATPEAPDDTLVYSLLTLSDVMGTGHHAAVSAEGPAAPWSWSATARSACARCWPLLASGPSASSQCRAMPTGRRSHVNSAPTSWQSAARPASPRFTTCSPVVVPTPCSSAWVPRPRWNRRLARSARRKGGLRRRAERRAGTTLAADVRRQHLRRRRRPVRAYLGELLADVLAGTIRPGRVFDLELPLERAPMPTARWTNGALSRLCYALKSSLECASWR